MIFEDESGDVSPVVGVGVEREPAVGVADRASLGGMLPSMSPAPQGLCSTGDVLPTAVGAESEVLMLLVPELALA